MFIFSYGKLACKWVGLCHCVSDLAYLPSTNQNKTPSKYFKQAQSAGKSVRLAHNIGSGFTSE